MRSGLAERRALRLASASQAYISHRNCLGGVGLSRLAGFCGLRAINTKANVMLGLATLHLNAAIATLLGEGWQAAGSDEQGARPGSRAFP
jgi:hypothetical protein